MSTENAGSAAPQESGGSTENQSKDTVAYATYLRTLSEVKKLKEQNRLYEEEKSKGHEQKLKEQNEWKALAEEKSKQAENLAKNLKELNDQVVNGMKYQEFEKHLGGRLKNRDYASFIDFEKIVINPETKTIDSESVKSAVSSFVKEHSALVEFSSGRVPNEAPKPGSIAGDKPVENMTPKELENYILTLNKNGKI
jgi:4-alpha-glucanotransferase